MNVKVGRYTGNGGDDRSISGVGFAPTIVIVKGDNGVAAYLRSSAFSGDTAKTLAGNTAREANFIQAFGADGFTVGTGLNANGTVYYYLALGGTSVAAVPYTGNGSDGRSVTGFGFQPDAALSARLSNNTNSVYFYTKDMAADASRTLTSSGPLTDRIQAIEADGVQVGTNADVNTNTIAYQMCGFEEVSGQCVVTTYTGNASDDRAITGLGFQPDFVLVKGAGTQTAQMRFKDQVGDSCLSVAAAVAASNRIQSLDADGFTVGSDATVNSNGVVYFVIAFKSDASAPAIGGSPHKRLPLLGVG